jgi:hypothetical protein
MELRCFIASPKWGELVADPPGEVVFRKHVEIEQNIRQEKQWRAV